MLATAIPMTRHVSTPEEPSVPPLPTLPAESGIRSGSFIVLAVLQDAWTPKQATGRARDCIKAFFQGPGFFARADVKDLVFRGTSSRDHIQALLLDASTLPFLILDLRQQLARLGSPRVPEQTPERSEQQAPGRSTADGGGEAGSALPDDLEQLTVPPEALVAEGSDEFEDVHKVDMSDPAKSLAVFKEMMKHKKEVKRQAQRQDRLNDANRQLSIARLMLSAHSAVLGQTPETAAASSAEASNQIIDGGEAGCVPAPAALHAVLVCVDLEWYEQDQQRLLEIGWSCWDSVSSSIVSKHWIVRENLNVRNGRYVPDHRNDFHFGQSVTGTKREGTQALQHDMEPLTWAQLWGLQQGEAAPRMALVGHGMACDLKMLSAMGIIIPAGTEIIDTNSLAWALMGGGSQVQNSLRSLLSWTEVPNVRKLHNGGNDARYTLEVMLRMCGAGVAEATA